MNDPARQPMKPEAALTGGEPVHRRGFLRRLGTTLAIGAGVVLVPASRAHARPGIDSFSQCCPFEGLDCKSGGRLFQCYTNCPGSSGPCYVCSKSSGCFSQDGCICG